MYQRRCGVRGCDELAAFSSRRRRRADADSRAAEDPVPRSPEAHSSDCRAIGVSSTIDCGVLTPRPACAPVFRRVLPVEPVLLRRLPSPLSESGELRSLRPGVPRGSQAALPFTPAGDATARLPASCPSLRATT